MDFTSLFTDIHVWRQRNYPTETDSLASLGLGEEIGELMRCENKQAIKLRGPGKSGRPKRKKKQATFLSLSLELRFVWIAKNTSNHALQI